MGYEVGDEEGGVGVAGVDGRRVGAHPAVQRAVGGGLVERLLCALVVGGERGGVCGVVAGGARQEGGQPGEGGGVALPEVAVHGRQVLDGRPRRKQPQQVRRQVARHDLDYRLI